jgi:hypothetical protein
MKSVFHLMNTDWVLFRVCVYLSILWVSITNRLSTGSCVGLWPARTGNPALSQVIALYSSQVVLSLLRTAWQHNGILFLTRCCQLRNKHQRNTTQNTYIQQKAIHIYNFYHYLVCKGHCFGVYCNLKLQTVRTLCRKWVYFMPQEA